MAKKSRSRKGRISEEQVMEMLRLHRQGKSISAIAEATGCHRQTVRAYLRQRQGDILADEVKKQVLVEELRNHFQELRDFASYRCNGRFDASSSEMPGLTGLKVRMPGPISLAGLLGLSGPGSSRYVSSEWGRMYYPPLKDRHLFQALREHTKDSDLWVHLDSWQKEVGDYEAVSLQLLQWVANKTEPERWHKIDPEHMDSVQWWLFGNILLVAGGGEQERLRISGRELRAPSDWVVARVVPGVDPQDFNDWLRQILSEAEALSVWESLVSATKHMRQEETQSRLRDIALNLEKALGGIELMRAFPGRCHLCPI